MEKGSERLATEYVNLVSRQRGRNELQCDMGAGQEFKVYRLG